jgi:hypothetical protein
VVICMERWLKEQTLKDHMVGEMVKGTNLKILQGSTMYCFMSPLVGKE